MLGVLGRLVRFCFAGDLMWSMAPGRHSLRVAARTKAAPPAAASGLITPRGNTIISKAKLKQLGSLQLKAESEVEEPGTGSVGVSAGEEFRLVNLVPQAEGIKRKLEFGPELRSVNDLNRGQTISRNFRARKMRANAKYDSGDDAVKGSQPETGLRSRRKLANEGIPRATRAKTESLGDDVELLSIVKQEFPEEAAVLRRGRKVQREGQEVDEEAKEILISVKQESPGSKSKSDSKGKMLTPKVEELGKDEDEHREIDSIVKRERRGEAGKRRRKLQSNLFSREVKVKTEAGHEQEVAKEGSFVTVKLEPEEKGVGKRKRKLPKQATPKQQAEDGQQRQAATVKEKLSPGLELIRVRPVSGAQLASGPFPSYARPFPEECQQVKDLLSGLHGDLPEYERHKVSCPTIEQNVHVQPLHSLGPPRLEPKIYNRRGVNDKSGLDERDNGGSLQLSLTLAGSSAHYGRSQGMVPTVHRRQRGTVLDSLVGTLLAQNTTDKNSRKAFASLKSTFPTWEEVLRADPMEVEDAIRCGGLAKSKAGRIRTILDTLLKERGEISMEYVRSMSNEAIKLELSRFKGVGPKTVACVLMFHLQREEFPVDTHVFRISKMLGWVPEQADREEAYLHLNQRIPNPLKFDLHCLFVTHGKRCPKCAKRNTQQPADGACPLLNWKSKWSQSSPALPKLDFV